MDHNPAYYPQLRQRFLAAAGFDQKPPPGACIDVAWVDLPAPAGAQVGYHHCVPFDKIC